MPYLTSLDWLHPVAMKVLGERKGRDDAETVQSLIRVCCWIAPINGEYIDIFNAVYEGIVFLNELKSKENDIKE